MSTTAPSPGSPEWMRLVTASKVAAIIGVSPWDSPYSMWMRMKGLTAPVPITDAMKRGHLLEPAILAWWRGEHPEYPDCTEQPYYALGGWAGATPDLVARTDARVQESVLVDAKSAARVEDWDNDGDDGTSIDGVPIYYWVSSQWQMHVSGIHTVYIALIGPYLEFKEYRIEYDAAHSAAVETHCREFFDSLKADEPPALDGSVATYDVARKQHDGVDKEQTVEIPDDTAVLYINALREAKEAAEAERLVKSEILTLMGDAAYADCAGIRVCRRQAGNGAASLRQVAKDPNAIFEASAILKGATA